MLYFKRRLGRRAFDGLYFKRRLGRRAFDGTFVQPKEDYHK